MKISKMQSWTEAWHQRKFLIHFTLSLSTLFCIVLFIPHFFFFIQERNGTILNDPLLKILPPRDLSAFTFTLIYLGILTAIITFLFSPWLFVRGLEAYCILTVIRITCIWLVPLNDPPGLVILNDPFVNLIGYGGKVITRDLFFSGHTSTLFLLFLAAPHRGVKLFLLLITVLVASSLLIQHVHYTVDVLAAPLFAFLSYRLAFGTNKNL